MWTRQATAVFFGPMHGPGLPSFTSHPVGTSKDIVAQPLLTMKNPDVSMVFNILKGLYQEHKKLQAGSNKTDIKGKVKKPEPTREELINQKRAFIATILKNQSVSNYAEVSRISKASYETIKRVERDVLLKDKPDIYFYNNVKTSAEMERLNLSLNSLQGTFQTISDLRRQNPKFSRKFIARHLKMNGYKWRQMQRKRKVPKKEKPEERKIVEVICHLALSHNSRSAKVIFIDEAHFPLFQTADHRWTLADRHEELTYNRRPASEAKLSVIAACDLEGFIAMQVYVKDITKEDFLFFLQELLKRYDKDTRVTVLADNATWHTSPTVMEARAGQFIHLNVPGLFRVNAIENCFSFIRSEFRKRPTVASLEEEAKLLVNIFFHIDNTSRFMGIHKNHLRQLLLLLRDNSPKLRHIKENFFDEW